MQVYHPLNIKRVSQDKKNKDYFFRLKSFFVVDKTTLAHISFCRRWPCQNWMQQSKLENTTQRHTTIKLYTTDRTRIFKVNLKTFILFSFLCSCIPPRVSLRKGNMILSGGNFYILAKLRFNNFNTLYKSESRVLSLYIKKDQIVNLMVPIFIILFYCLCQRKGLCLWTKAKKLDRQWYYWLQNYGARRVE